MKTIVIVWTSTRLNGLKNGTGKHVARATWLNDGDGQDVAKAEAYCKVEDARNDGTSDHHVFVYENEAKPLERAVADYKALVPA